MFRPKPKPTHKFVARIPELSRVLLRDTESNALELWAESVGLQVRAIRLHGVEFEYDRKVYDAFRIIDDDYNRKHCPHEIGRIYIDRAPVGASTRRV